MIASTRTKKPSYSDLEATIKIQAEQLAELKFQLTEMQRLIFGTKSERFVPAGSLPGAPTLYDLPAAEVPVETIEKTITVTVPVKKKNEGHPGRNPLPAHLPREITVLEPLQDVTGLTQIGQDVTEMLDYTPGKLIVASIFVLSMHAQRVQASLQQNCLSFLLPRELQAPGC